MLHNVGLDRTRGAAAYDFVGAEERADQPGAVMPPTYYWFSHPDKLVLMEMTHGNDPQT